LAIHAVFVILRAADEDDGRSFDAVCHRTQYRPVYTSL